MTRGEKAKELFLKGTFKVTKDPAYETGDA